ncbi:MAG TPA: MSMEG_3727 family PQQ-associated protein, partial [Micromonosporaceae bacterium]|nr:MSMEG_3727 family PQQ-associated protein [Micromonosporaceae bacterium]
MAIDAETVDIKRTGGEAPMTSVAHERSDLLHEIGLDAQNKGTIGRLLVTGNIGHAEEQPDGRMRAQLRINPDELCWDPSILVMP